MRLTTTDSRLDAASRALVTAPEHQRATAALAVAIADARDHGRPVPCLDGPLPPVYWTSDDDDEQEAAARACLACPALGACHTAGSFEAPGGVWAGLRRTYGRGGRPHWRDEGPDWPARSEAEEGAAA